MPPSQEIPKPLACAPEAVIGLQTSNKRPCTLHFTHPQPASMCQHLRGHDGLALVVLLAVVGDRDGFYPVPIYLPVALRRRLLRCLRYSNSKPSEVKLILQRIVQQCSLPADDPTTSGLPSCQQLAATLNPDSRVTDILTLFTAKINPQPHSNIAFLAVCKRGSLLTALQKMFIQWHIEACMQAA